MSQILQHSMTANATSTYNNKVCIVGSGIIGLSVAFQVQSQLPPDTSITIISEEPYEKSTSFGAGGLWEPYQLTGNPEHLTLQWGQFTFTHFMELHSSEEATVAGVSLVSSYNLFCESELPLKLPFWKDIVIGFQEMKDSDIKKLHLPVSNSSRSISSSKWVAGYAYSTIAVELKYYMSWMISKLIDKGAQFQTGRSVSSLARLAEEEGFDVVVNCTGLGAQTALVDVVDSNMYEVRGQVIRVKAPHIKSNWNFGPYYVIPNIDSVVLGGTAQEGNSSTAVSESDTEDILNGVCALLPALKHAPVLQVWAGLRPCRRTGVRVEAHVQLVENGCNGNGTKNSNNSCGGGGSSCGGGGGSGDMEFHKKVIIAHCYGHGGCGITLGMGSAHDLVMNHIMPLLLQLPAVQERQPNTSV